MNVSLENYLQKIDTSFKEKSQKDTYMIYVMVFGLIFAFTYLLFWETSELEFTKKREEVVAIQSKINIDDRYLQNNSLQKVTNIEKATRQSQTDIIQVRDDNEYIKHQIEKISFLIYDEQTWGKYLHSVSQKAKDNNIKILKLSNASADNNNSFGHVLDISIVSSGKYKDTINFINSLEQSKLVVDLHTLSIKANENIDTNLTISVWGIIY